MSSQPSSGRVLPRREPPPPTFEAHEWELLTRLPIRLVVAAATTSADTRRRTVDECLAGINAIAAGGDSGSDLVRAVVSEIYAEADPDPPTAEQFRDRDTGITEVLVSCRAAALVLHDRVNKADELAYRQWLESVVHQVCGGDERTGPAARRLLEDVLQALRNE